MKKTTSLFRFIFKLYLLISIFGFIVTLFLGFIDASEIVHLLISFLLSSGAMFCACYIMAKKYNLPKCPYNLVVIIIIIETLFALGVIGIGLLVFQGMMGADLEIILSFFTAEIILKALGIFILTIITKSFIAYYTFSHVDQSKHNSLIA